MLSGIDVSSYQRSVDWDAVAGDGVSFAWTKLTGGAWYTNPYGAEAWAGIGSSGLVRGAYHFAFESSGEPGGDAAAEADFFCAALEAGGLSVGDLVALDIEDGPDVPLGDWALSWLRRVESRTGIRPFVYTGTWFADPHGFADVPELAGYPLWLAAYQQTPPTPPLPWSTITIWQHADDGVVSGVVGGVDLNQFDGTRDQLVAYGLAAGGGTVTPPPAEPLPLYDPTFPAFAQNDDWSCAPTSTRWALWAYGRQPSESWLENSMLTSSPPVVSMQLGLLDSSGAGLRDWLNREYGPAEYGGYLASNNGSVSFEEVCIEAATGRHPLMMGGRSWGSGGHWTGVRGYDSSSNRLLLANPASGYGGITQTMAREQFKAVGPFSLVRLTNPTAEGQPIPPRPPSGDPYAPWRATVGSGLLTMMQEDGTLPALRGSTWLPLGAPAPADCEECLGQNGTMYRWALTVGQGWRYRPS